MHNENCISQSYNHTQIVATLSSNQAVFCKIVLPCHFHAALRLEAWRLSTLAFDTMSNNDPESSDEDIATEQGKHLPPLSDWLYRFQEPDAGPAKKEWTKCWCVLQNRKLLYFKSKVDPASGELPEGYVQLQGSKVSLQSIKKSKCSLTITEV
jgi:hypothetical protein